MNPEFGTGNVVCPYRLSPQALMFPLVVTATLWYSPAATSLALKNDCTVLWPASLFPHPTTLPDRAPRLCPNPPAIFVYDEFGLGTTHCPSKLSPHASTTPPRIPRLCHTPA